MSPRGRLRVGGRKTGAVPPPPPQGGRIREKQREWVIRETVKMALAEYEREVGKYRDAYTDTLAAVMAGDMGALEALKEMSSAFLLASFDWYEKQSAKQAADMRAARLENLRMLRKHRAIIHEFREKGTFTWSAANTTFDMLQKTASSLNTTLFIARR